MTFPLTPAQFATLGEKLRTVPGVTVLPANPLSGVINTRDVTLAYSYDGVRYLDIDVTAKHSLAAKVTPMSVIQGRIQGLIETNS